MTIAEVSRQFDITPDTLRYYERIGLIPPVPRTKKRHPRLRPDLVQLDRVY